MVAAVEGVRDDAGGVEEPRRGHRDEDRQREAEGRAPRPTGGRASRGNWTSATHRPATGPNPGPTTIAPTTRIGAVEGDPDRGDGWTRAPCRAGIPRTLDALARPPVQLLPDDRVGGRARARAPRRPRNRRWCPSALRAIKPSLVDAQVTQLAMTTLASSRATSHMIRSPAGPWQRRHTDHVDRGRRTRTAARAPDRLLPGGAMTRRWTMGREPIRSPCCKIGCSLRWPASALRRGIRKSRGPDPAPLRLFSVRPAPVALRTHVPFDDRPPPEQALAPRAGARGHGYGPGVRHAG